MRSEHLIMYLPHQVKAKFKRNIKEYEIGTVNAVYTDRSIVCYDTVNSTPSKFKLLLHPKSNAYKILTSKYKIDFLDVADIYLFQTGELSVDELKFSMVKLLVRHHIDAFGYIDKKQAIDINTLNLKI